MYIDCKSALEISRLDTLGTRRDARCLDFPLKCVKHKKNRRLFSIKSNIPTCKARHMEKFAVNLARTISYLKSTIPYCKRLLNDH